MQLYFTAAGHVWQVYVLTTKSEVRTQARHLYFAATTYTESSGLMAGTWKLVLKESHLSHEYPNGEIKEMQFATVEFLESSFSALSLRFARSLNSHDCSTLP